MEAVWVNAFCSATANMFKTMINLEVTTGKPSIKTEPYPRADVSGMVGFSGEAQGSIALSFPKGTAIQMVSALLGTPITEINRDVSDAVGELANIVAGNAKVDIPQLKLSISLPQVVVGPNHAVSCQSNIPVVIIPYKSPMGDFVLEFSLKRT